MANTNTIKTRILHKYSEYQAWYDANTVLLAGEIGVVVIPAETGAVSQEPAIMFKVGDGTTPFRDLGWVYGMAADVHDWAKASTKPTYEAGEITGIDAYIAEYVNEQMGISVDTDTQYTITKVNEYQYKLMSKSKGDEAFATEVAVIDIPRYDDTQIKNDIDALEALVGTTSVAAQITAAIEALKLADTYEAKGAAATEAGKVQSALDTYKTENNAEIAGIKENYATKDQAQGYADAKDEAIAAAKKAGDDAQDAVDTLAGKVGEVPADKTVVQMISDAQNAATYDDTKVKEDIQANAEEIAKLNGNAETEGSVDYKIAQAVAAIMENPDETMNSINELVTWINDHAQDALELSNKVSANEKDIEALEGLVGTTGVAQQIADAIAAALTVDGVDKYALATDLTAAIARIAALEKDTHTHANKDVLDSITAEKVAAWDAKANDADLADIAKTGNVADLKQTEGDYIVFDCGTATTVI